MNRYNIITGLRRSGTSLTMLMARQAGIPIVGFKYTVFLEKTDGGIVMQTIPRKELRECNPNGYWEVGTITTKTGIKREHNDLGMDGDLIKITADAYYFSDPPMIDKTIVVMRNPRNVLQSMLNGKLFLESDINEAIQKNIRDLKRTFDAIQDHIVIKYEDILDNPLEECKKICNYLGKGNPELGAKVVDVKLNRSKPLKGNFKGLKELECLYKKHIHQI